MVLGSGWDAEKMLDLYLHDYMVKNNMHQAAAIFKKEADVFDTSVVIDTTEGFLHEWWSLFYDVYASRHLKHQDHEAKAEASVPKAMPMRENEKQKKRPRLPPSPNNQQRPRKCPKGTNSDKMLEKPSGGVNKLNISKSVATFSSHRHQQLPKHAQQKDNRNGISLGRTVTMDPMLYGMHNAILSVTGAQDAGTSAVNHGPLTRRPLKVLNSAFQAPNHEQQIQMTGEQQHPLLGQMIGQMRQNAEHQHQHQHDRLQQQQLLENGRKSTRTPYLRLGGSPLDNMNANEDITMEEDTESFLSYDDDTADGISTFSVLKRGSTACNKYEQKGFTFEEFGSLHSSKSKIVCCHFSSDGKFLASAGHEKKVLIWNMENFEYVKTSEGHSLLITDVRFRPSSTIFATSSFDRTVKIWDVARSHKPLSKLEGHTEHAMSLDFHPRQANLLCSCDSNDEIRLWNINQSTCTLVFKGATKQVRFQPRVGKLLATSSGNGINVFDVETVSPELYLGSGHAKEVISICWDASGKYLASVSEDSARVWSTATGGKCIYELKSNGNKFQSCTFHPGYSLLLIIGGYQSLELWNPSESSKTLTVPAHKGLVAALAESPKTQMVASTSHDQCVKLWK